MSIGSRHTLRGRLNKGQDGLLILRVDGGGQWRLDAPAHAGALIGQKVSVEGTRSGFDLLDVHKIESL